MSIVVFAIAAIPAACVAWVGYNSTSLAALWGAAIVAVLLGIVTGNPVFVGLDLVAVAFGFYIGNIEQSKKRAKFRPSAKPVPTPPQIIAPPADKKSSDSWVFWIVGATFVVIF